jgi:hypothetical protein
MHYHTSECARIAAGSPSDICSTLKIRFAVTLLNPFVIILILYQIQPRYHIECGNNSIINKTLTNNQILLNNVLFKNN